MLMVDIRRNLFSKIVVKYKNRLTRKVVENPWMCSRKGLMVGLEDRVAIPTLMILWSYPITDHQRQEVSRSFSTVLHEKVVDGNDVAPQTPHLQTEQAKYL